MSSVISVQFGNAGKLYDFDSQELDLTPGDHVIVETERGVSIALVATAPRKREATDASNLLPIRRKATYDDLATAQRNAIKEKEAYDFSLKRITERNMEMKLVKVEYLFDSSKAIFFFTADGRIDFRELVKDLAHTFHTRIEMRQIGVRDEAKMVGGIGICGRELCCSSFLRDFQPVSVKMAKEQNLALNPSKISGQCGRLLCCLEYEYETYSALRKGFPKCGKRAHTCSVCGTVDKFNILTGDITLKTDDDKLVVVKQSDLIDEAKLPEIQQKETAAPRSPQPQRQGQRRQESRTQTETVESKPETAEKTENKTNRKRRSRRHGHRKPNESAPGNSSGNQEK